MPLPPLTLAVPGADELHVTVATIAAPNWSFVLAESCVVAPVEIVVAGAVIVTVVSTCAGVTVSVMGPVTTVVPDVAVAVIVTEPTATPVTSPDALTVATPCADDPHVTVAATAAPFWSLGLAMSCSVVPATSDVDAALTETDVSTGCAVTVICVEPCTDSVPEVAVAVIVVEPATSASTSPEELTVATVGADDAHVTVAENALPLWSRGVAVSCSVWPATTDCAGDVTPTEVSTGVGGVTAVVPPPPEQPAKASATATNERIERAEMEDR
jgi:hypothetical protein